MDVKRTYSGAPWEPRVGYCRGVRVGDRIWISGTAPVEEDGSTHAPGDGYRQAVRCLEIVRGALRDLDADFRHVVRTRMYVTDIERLEEYGRAHQEFFGGDPPATTMVEVRRLVDPEMLIEIEVEAVVGD